MMYINRKDIGLLIRMIKLRYDSFQNFKIREFEINNSKWIQDDKLLNYIKDNWANYEKFDIKEIFEINNIEFRRVVFTYITPKQIMHELGAVRVKTDGFQMNHGKYNVYEIYEAKASKLDSALDGNIYSVKCWCTTTNEEHWLWVDEIYKDDPLSAIASTAMFDKNVIPVLKKFHRQGDIFLIELDEPIELSGEIVSLSKEQYFNLIDQEA